MIRNIVFDMGHVLYWYEPLKACRAPLQNEADAQLLCEAFFGGPLWVEIDHGRLDGDAFLDAVKALLPGRLHRAADTVYRGMPGNVLSPVAGMDGLADAMLARGFRVYILSNAGLWMGRTRDFIPNIGRFHGVMFSAEEKLVKPDPRLYLRFQEKFRLRPEECFFIDDKEENVQSAAALGWRTYRFTGDADALKKALDAL